MVDAKTGQDLTQATLAQIILESRGAGKMLPIPLLLQLIRMREDALAEFMGRWMTWALAVYTQARQGARTIAQYNPLAMAPFAATNALARLLNGPSTWTSEPEPLQPPPRPRPSPTHPPAPATWPTCGASSKSSKRACRRRPSADAGLGPTRGASMLRRNKLFVDSCRG